MLAKDDPEINLSGKGVVYAPPEFMEEDIVDQDIPVEVTEEEAIQAEEAMKAEMKSSGRKAAEKSPNAV